MFCKTAALLTLLASAAQAAIIQVDSAEQEVTVLKAGANGEHVGGNPSGITNANCTLGEAILAVNRRQIVDNCVTRAENGFQVPFPANGPITIQLQQGLIYRLSRWGTTLYGPTGLPAIGSAIEGPFATSAISEIIIEGNGAVIERSGFPDTPPFRLFAVAGSITDQDGLTHPARETNALLTPEPGYLLSPGSLTLRRVTLRNGFARGGMTLGAGGGGLGAGGAIFSAGTLVIEQSTLYGNVARGGGLEGARVEFQRDGGAGMGGEQRANGECGGGGFAGVGSTLSGGGTVSNAVELARGLLNGSSTSAAGFGGGGSCFFSAMNAGFGGGGGSGRNNNNRLGNGGFGGGGGGVSNFTGDAYIGGDGGFGGGGGSVLSQSNRPGRPGFGGGRGGMNESDSNPITGGGGAGLGGAIFNAGGSVRVVNSTLSNNRAEGGEGYGPNPDARVDFGVGLGGAIFARNGSTEIISSTLHLNVVASSNSELRANAALYVLADAAVATVRLENSIFSKSIRDEFLSLPPNDVIFNTRSGGSVVQLNTINVVSNGGLIGGTVLAGDPLLGPLRDNGGLTLSHYPASNSAVIDSGLSTLTVDQRGSVRPVGSAPDIGAVEALEIMVRNTLDAGTGSLRQTVLDAALLGQRDVRFADTVRGTIALTSPIALANTINVIGPGANLLELRPSNFGGVLVNPSGSSASVSGLGMRGVISGFNTTDVVLGNQGILRLDGVDISNNAVTAINNSGDLIVLSSAITQNSGPIARAVVENTGTMRLVNTTLAGNSIATVSVIRNAAAGQLKLINCTLAKNTSIFIGGNAGLTNNGSAQVFNSIISENTGVQIIGNDLAPISSNNLIGSIAVQLGPLQNNGGRTTTLAIPDTSPARDAGSNAQVTALQFGPTPIFDQRGSGFPRIAGPAVDIGAFEIQPPPEVVFASGFE
jgi:hypothetical protein